MKQIEAKVENKDIIKAKHKQICDAALELFSKHGYHKTTMRDIARTSGINLSYLYHYISSKDDVLYLFYNQLLDLYKPVYLSLKESNRDNPIDELRELIPTVLRIIHENQSAFLTMYTESRHLEPDSLSSVLSQETEILNYLRDLIQRGVEKGCFNTAEPLIAANIIQYLLLLEPLRGWGFRKHQSFDEFVDYMTKFVMAALGAVEGTE